MKPPTKELPLRQVLMSTVVIVVLLLSVIGIFPSCVGENKAQVTPKKHSRTLSTKGVEKIEEGNQEKLKKPETKKVEATQNFVQGQYLLSDFLTSDPSDKANFLLQEAEFSKAIGHRAVGNMVVIKVEPNRNKAGEWQIIAQSAGTKFRMLKAVGLAGQRERAVICVATVSEGMAFRFKEDDLVGVAGDIQKVELITSREHFSAAVVGGKDAEVVRIYLRNVVLRRVHG